MMIGDGRRVLLSRAAGKRELAGVAAAGPALQCGQLAHDSQPARRSGVCVARPLRGCAGARNSEASRGDPQG